MTWNYSASEYVSMNVHDPNSPPIPREHSRHDGLLIARFAAGDSFAGEVEQAQALVESCSSCADLAADVRSLMSATSRLPETRRTRDFRLSAGQAEQLRGSRLERFLRRLAAPGLAPLRPLAGVAISLGLALVVVGTALPSPASAPAMDAERLETRRNQNEVLGSPVPAAAPEYAPGAEPDDAGVTPPNGVAAGGEDDDRTFAEQEELTIPAEATDAFPRGLLVYAGVVLALVSLGVLVLSWFARTRTRDPLLR
jgi:hypothetical protein